MSATDQAAFEEAVQLGESYRAQVAALEEQRALIANVHQDYRRARETLESLRGAKDGDDVLVPLGGGAFVHAKLSNPDRVLATIGQGLHAESTLADALKRVDERIEGVSQAERRLNEELQRVEAEMVDLSARIQSMAEGQPRGR
jgi:prefoldin alpha subunit